MVVHTPTGRTDQTDAAPSASTPDTEALIEEARRRRRVRRRRNAVVLVPLVVVALVVALVSLTSGGGPSRPPAGAAHRPGGSPAAAGTQTAPPGTGLVGRGPTAVDFVDADHGWIASGSLTALVGNPTIVRTTDGGTTWQQIPVPKTAGVRISTASRYYFGGLVGIHFATPMLGWYYQAGILWHTADGGMTWTRVRLPVGGAVVSVTSTGSEVWALVRDGACTPPAADCTPQAVSLFVAPLPGRTWRQVGGLIDVGRYAEGSLLPASSHGVLVLAATGTYAVSSAAGRRDRAVTPGARATPLAPSCQAVGALAGRRLAGVCAVGGGGNAGATALGVSSDTGATWHTVLGGPPTTQYEGYLETNGDDAVFYVTGGQTLWRTGTGQPGWQAVLQVPTSSTDEIDTLYVSGTRGLALVSAGTDAHWFHTHDGGATWQPVTLP